MCINGRIEEPATEHGLRLCIATHPCRPNHSGTSRGRKVHLDKGSRLTICNLMVEGYIPASDMNWSVVQNGRCRSCFNPKRITELEKRET